MKPLAYWSLPSLALVLALTAPAGASAQPAAVESSGAQPSLELRPADA